MQKVVIRATRTLEPLGTAYANKHWSCSRSTKTAESAKRSSLTSYKQYCHFRLNCARSGCHVQAHATPHASTCMRNTCHACLQACMQAASLPRVSSVKDHRNHRSHAEAQLYGHRRKQAYYKTVAHTPRPSPKAVLLSPRLATGSSDGLGHFPISFMDARTTFDATNTSGKQGARQRRTQSEKGLGPTSQGRA